MLSVGKKVYVPGYGAGNIDKIEDKKVDDIIRKYVGLSLLLDNIYLLIPTTKLEDYRIRSITCKDDFEEKLAILKEKPQAIEKKWSKRYRLNNEKISEGSMFNMLEVIRDLHFLKENSLLPPGEHKILSRVENLICSEIALIYDISLAEAKAKLEQFV